MKNIHILPTDKPSRLRYNLSNVLALTKEPYRDYSKQVNQHISITSDEKIKEGDWVLFKAYNETTEIVRVTTISNNAFTSKQGFGYGLEYCKKIILTTDPDLIKEGVQAIDDEFLEWFVKNPSCEEVEVEKESLIIQGESDYFNYDNGIKLNPNVGKYKIIIPKEEPKKYKCTECHWLGLFNEMKNEQDTDYDQYCCPKCNNVMYDCRFDKWYLEEPKTSIKKEYVDDQDAYGYDVIVKEEPKQELKVGDNTNFGIITDIKEYSVCFGKNKVGVDIWYKKLDVKLVPKQETVEQGIDFGKELSKWGYNKGNSIDVEILVNEILPDLFKQFNK
jgi:hypothetical protein